MDYANLANYLEGKFDNLISLIKDKTAFKVDHANWSVVSSELKNDKSLDFDYLMCISSYDCGDNRNYGVAYNLYSTTLKHYIEIRVEVSDENSIPSVVQHWKTADWHEREAYDMMGISFLDHPNLKRILLADDWEGHPLRKKFKEPDYYHGMPVPKDKSYWE